MGNTNMNTNLNNVCNWKKIDFGQFGCSDYEYVTDCGKNYDVDKTIVDKFCPHCGKIIVLK